MLHQPNRDEEVKFERLCLGLFAAFVALLVLSFIVM